MRMDLLRQKSVDVLKIALFDFDGNTFTSYQCFNLAVVLAYELPDSFYFSFQNSKVHIILFLVVLLVNVFKLLFLKSIMLRLNGVRHLGCTKLAIFIAYATLSSRLCLQEVLQGYLAVGNDAFDVRFGFLYRS